MDPLKRNNPGVRATNHENRIQALERRLAMDYPIHAGTTGEQTPNSVTAGTSELIGYANPGDTQDTAAGQFEVDPTGEWFMLPPAWEGVFGVYCTIPWAGGSTPADPSDCRALALLEVLENVAGTWTPLGGGVNCHGYREHTWFYQSGDPIWQTMYLHGANNAVSGNEDKRYGVSNYFANFSAVNITVVGYPVIVQLLEDEGGFPCYG